MQIGFRMTIPRIDSVTREVISLREEKMSTERLQAF